MRPCRRTAGCGHAAADGVATAAAGGVGRRTSRRDERRAAIAATIEAAGRALAEGDISGEHLDAVASVVPGELIEAVVESQEELFGLARRQSPDRFRREIAWFVRDVERQRGVDRSAKQRANRRGRCCFVPATGMIELRAELDPVTGAHVTTRIRTEYRRLLKLDRQATGSGAPHHEADPQRTVEQRWAYAIANAVCAGPAGKAGVDDRLPVVVVEREIPEARTDLGGCEIAGVDELPAGLARYMACDRPLLALSLDPEGKPIALTHFDRHASAAQRRALDAIWGRCVGPECEVVFADCQIHHTVPWTTRAETRLDELVPLCSRHHRLVHEAGWILERLPGNSIQWVSPDGQTHTCMPNAPPNTT